MSKRTLVTLLIALALLAGVAFLADRNAPEPVGPRASHLLAPLDGAVEELRLLNRDKTKEYTLRQSSTLTWDITYPVEDEANEAVVLLWLGQLASSTKQPAFDAEEPTPKQLEETGLATPKGRLIAKRGTASTTIEFGDETFPPGHIYARIDGVIYKIQSGIEQIVETNLHDLRNPLLFRTDPASIQRVRVMRAGEQGKAAIQLERGRSGWEIPTATGKQPADPVRVAEILSLLVSARAVRFLGSTQEVESEPWLVIKMDGQFGPETVRVSRPTGGAVTARKNNRTSGLVLDGRNFERLLLRPAEDLISTRLWTFSPRAASQIRIDDADPKTPALVLERLRDEPGFKLAAPEARSANHSAVNDLVDAIERTRLVRAVASEHAIVAKVLLNKAHVLVHLDSPRERRTKAVEVRLARSTEGDVYGQVVGTEVVYLVESPEFAVFTKRWWHYAALRAFRLPGDTPAQRVTIEQGDKGKRVFVRGATGEWEVDGTVDEDFGDPVYGYLVELRAAAVVGEKDLVAKTTPVATVECFGLRADSQERRVGVLRLYDAGEKDLMWSHANDDQIVYRVKKRHARALIDFLGR